jgi:hypothetical protein
MPNRGEMQSPHAKHKPSATSTADDKQREDRGRARSSPNGQINQSELGQRSANPPPSANDFDAGASLLLDKNYDLLQPNIMDWKEQSADVVNRYYAQAESDFFRIVNDYLDQANLATERYKSISITHARWRFGIIIATGFLAALNVCAAFDLFKFDLWGTPPKNVTLPAILTAIAALYAGGLTVAGNLENFFNHGSRFSRVS